MVHTTCVPGLVVIGFFARDLAGFFAHAKNPITRSVFSPASKKIRPSSWPARPAAKCRDRIFISQGAKKSGRTPGRLGREKSSRVKNPARRKIQPISPCRQAGKLGPERGSPWLHSFMICLFLPGRLVDAAKKIRPGQGEPSGCDKSYHHWPDFWTLRKNPAGLLAGSAGGEMS